MTFKDYVYAVGILKLKAHNFKYVNKNCNVFTINTVLPILYKYFMLRISNLRMKSYITS